MGGMWSEPQTILGGKQCVGHAAVHARETSGPAGCPGALLSFPSSLVASSYDSIGCSYLVNLASRAIEARQIRITQTVAAGCSE